MAVVKPFKGIRPPKELVEKVESRPYDVLNSDEAREEAGNNEMSLYHIIKPEIDFSPETSEYDPRVYEKAAENFQKFQDNGWLVQDDKEQYYKRAKSASSIFYKHKILYSYVVPDSFEEFRDMHKISPLDYYWSLITECAESECCYIVMEMIRNAALIINREMNGEWLHPFECDYEIERNEDLYYCVIQTLFAIYADKLI